MARWLISAAILATAAHASRPAHDRVAIPAGSFSQGSTRGDEDERPVRKVTVKSFAIDRTEAQAHDFAMRARAKLGTFDPSPARSTLERVCDYVVQRRT